MTQSFTVRNLLLIILALLGFSAITGGLALIVSPSGKLLNLHLAFLIHSPFNDFLIPGIILFFILGLLPLLLIYALLKKPICIIADQFNVCKNMHWAWTYTIYNAVALIIWIHVEMRIGGELYYRVQLLISVIAIFIIILALTPQVRKHYRKRKRIADPYYLVDSFD